MTIQIMLRYHILLFFKHIVLDAVLIRSLQWCTIFIKLSPYALAWYSRFSKLRSYLLFPVLSTLYLCYVSARNLVFSEINHISLWLHFCFFLYFPPSPVTHSSAKQMILLIVSIAWALESGLQWAMETTK